MTAIRLRLRLLRFLDRGHSGNVQPFASDPSSKPGALWQPADPVAVTYLDSAGTEHRIPAATVSRLRHVLGSPPAGAEDSAPIVARRGQPVPVTGRLELEGGGFLDLAGRIPEDCPFGYHTLPGPVPRQLIVGPGRCYLPDRRAWGWTVQLYAARSARSWGIGDLGDLRTLTRWAAGQGAGFVLVNPLHAVAPTLPQQASPYFPTSRAFRNPIYLRIEDVPGADGVDLGEFQRAGRALNAARADRPGRGVAGQARPRCASCSPKLARAARVRPLAGRAGHGADPVRDLVRAGRAARAELAGLAGGAAPTRTAPAVPRFGREAGPAVDFHAWLQWLLHLQLADQAPGVAVIQDLPIGVDPDGADAWAWQQVMAEGVTRGRAAGPVQPQRPGLGAAPVRAVAAAAGRLPARSSRRSGPRCARHGGLRIDHVMGLLRLWWIPGGQPADRGRLRALPG